MPPPPVNITIMLVISPHNNQFPYVRREFGELKPIWNLKMYIIIIKLKKKLNSVALVRERTIPTERPPPVGEVSANFCG